MPRIFVANKQRASHEGHLESVYQTWKDVINESTLRKEDFERILEELKMIQEHTLVAVTDLRSRGLVVGTSISDMVVSVEDVSDMEDANVDMNTVQLNADDTVFDITSVPQPIIHKSYRVPWRQEGFGYKNSVGNNRAMRKVLEKYDSLVVNGDSSISITINGAAWPIYGYTTQPNRTTDTISDWTAATTNLLSDVNGLFDKLFNTNKITATAGSVMMYVANDLWTVLRQQAFANKGQLTFFDQIKQDYPELIDIKPLESLASKNVLLVVLQSEFVQLGEAVSPVIVPHTKKVAIAPQDFTGYAVGTPILKQDSNDLTGIVHGST